MGIRPRNSDALIDSQMFVLKVLLSFLGFERFFRNVEFPLLLSAQIVAFYLIWCITLDPARQGKPSFWIFTQPNITVSLLHDQCNSWIALTKLTNKCNLRYWIVPTPLVALTPLLLHFRVETRTSFHPTLRGRSDYEFWILLYILKHRHNTMYGNRLLSI